MPIRSRALIARLPRALSSNALALRLARRVNQQADHAHHRRWRATVGSARGGNVDGSVAGVLSAASSLAATVTRRCRPRVGRLWQAMAGYVPTMGSFRYTSRPGYTALCVAGLRRRKRSSQPSEWPLDCHSQSCRNRGRVSVIRLRRCMFEEAERRGKTPNEESTSNHD